MADLIHYRGPDDEGYVLFPKLSAMPLICGGLDTPVDTYLSCATAYAPREQFDSLGDCPVTLALGHRRLSIVDLSPLGNQPIPHQRITEFCSMRIHV